MTTVKYLKKSNELDLKSNNNNNYHCVRTTYIPLIEIKNSIRDTKNMVGIKLYYIITRTECAFRHEINEHNFVV